ncbi:30S ribosomal protein S5 alanine N-acetyltransferase [Plesiomonas shigelloides]|uniref:ribosomal protein S5-alanine N-acetyltransferase n=1 Tax=Plesiomonas shigelloides TaxID=703 RepID=UPI0012628E5F|nr:ribosomal protein S5-alanine N-acetyltransferase [Plesiomonas shigelloides]KAB7713616.1 30S ribosomal protein S5 alanine N-acetyltransferase [Plesiomonas shigelloides]
MFGRLTAPQVRLCSERLIVRLAQEKDAAKIADYYTLNRAYLKPWEPARDESHFRPSGWEMRLSLITQLHRQGNAFCFILLDPQESEVLGIANYSNVVRGVFHACYLGYSLGELHVGKGLMYEALRQTNRYIFEQQHLHRIMANYMPHNQRSGNLLKRLGFEREGFARDYLLIDGQWQDHVLTALCNPRWRVPERA